MFKNLLCTLGLVLLCTASLIAQTRTVTEADLSATGDYIWSADTVYTISGYVYVESGSTLTIEPGTKIEGLGADATENRPASALIVARGAQIFADGTADKPIIFTATGDDGSLDPVDDRASWGGVIILGDATVGEENGNGQANIEGIPVEDRTLYGGANDADNSGVLRYVSIRYGGAKLSNDNEINGLTLGGVGNGTTLEYVEVFGNSDDGIEFFGGTVNIKHAVVAFCGDDSFDTDQNWSGKAQFIFTIQFPNDPSGNNQNGGEHDGSEDPSDNGGLAQTFYNATYIGMGADMDNGEGNNALRLKKGVAANYINSIFTEFGKDGLRIEDNAVARIIAGDFTLRNNIWWNFGDGNAPADFLRVDSDVPASVTAVADAIVAQNQTIASPMLNGISREPNGMLDPRPGVGSPALNDAADVPANDDFLERVTYRGAFSFDDNWATGWTNLDALGYFGDLQMDRPVKMITDADIVAGQTYDWTPDTIYRLSGYVYAENGACINIAAGTTIQGLPALTTENRPTSALIIAQGAKIKAIGTANNPIIFTGVDVDDEDIEDVTDNRSTWGGVIILGRAPVGEENGTGMANIEGIPVEARSIYGGTDEDDDSGVMRYVSILYSGAKLSNDNEINGLTLGGVGRGTELEYIEVYANSDDGIEFFGGTVDIKHAAVIFCGDDSFDTDQNWSGRGQFLFTMMYPNDPSGNNQNGGEHDGSENPAQNGGEVQTFWNATYIGMGAAQDNGEGNTGLRIKKGAAVNYANSIFTEFGKDGARLEDNSITRYAAGDFTLRNNIWWGFGDGNAAADFIRVESMETEVIAALVAQDQKIETPDLFRISWDDISSNNGADGKGTDPRPNVDSPAAGAAIDVPVDGFFDAADYIGAFDPVEPANYWLNWTHAFRKGVIVDAQPNLTSTIDYGNNESGIRLAAPAPNPADNVTNLTFNLPLASNVALKIYDQSGRIISERNLGLQLRGENKVQLNVRNLANGIYYVLLNTQSGVVAQRMVVSH